VNDYVIYTPPDVPAGKYGPRIGSKTRYTPGKVQLSIDGNNQVSVQDSYTPPWSDAFVERDLGSKTFLHPGDRDFTFTLTGKHSSSSGYEFVLDYVDLVSEGLTWSGIESSPGVTISGTNVPVDIVTADGSLTTVLINQQEFNGVWVSLGICSPSPSNASVTIRTEGTEKHVTPGGAQSTPL
jgi:hypothetical protein